METAIILQSIWILIYKIFFIFPHFSVLFSSDCRGDVHWWSNTSVGELWVKLHGNIKPSTYYSAHQIFYPLSQYLAINKHKKNTHMNMGSFWKSNQWFENPVRGLMHSDFILSSLQYPPFRFQHSHFQYYTTGLSISMSKAFWTQSTLRIYFDLLERKIHSQTDSTLPKREQFGKKIS